MYSITEKINWLSINVNKCSTEDSCISYQFFLLFAINLICLCRIFADTLYVQKGEAFWCLEEVLMFVVWIVRDKHIVENIVISPNFRVWKFSRNCAFAQNFHTMKLGEITAFYVVTCLMRVIVHIEKINWFSFLLCLWIHVMFLCFSRHNHMIRVYGLTISYEAS